MSTINKNFQPYSQQGVGLVEVLVSLLLIAVAILGFSSMQMKAVQATDEGMVRNKALTVIRGGGETMRSSPKSYEDAFQAKMSELALKSNTDVKAEYEDAKGKCTIDQTYEPDKPENSFCTMAQLASKDAINIVFKARQSEVKVNMMNCPMPASSTNTKKCFITSWGETEPTTTGDKRCFEIVNNEPKYRNGATCFVMEAY